jgi:choline-sulfatase
VQLDRSLLLALPFLCFGCGHDEPKPAPAAPPVAHDAAPKTKADSKPTAAKTEAAPAGAVTEHAAPSGPFNVILITVDALRADAMQWAGYKRDVAPNLAKLAKESVVFDRHRATTSFTAQSIPAILSGRIASTLYRSGYFFAGYTDANEFFPEALQHKGIHTIGVQSHLYFDRGKGLNQGFDEWAMVPGITFNERTDEQVTSDKTTALFEQHLDNVKGRFFAWTHYTDPHAEYKKHSECDFGNSDRDRYDSEVCFTDQWIGKFLAWAEKKPWWSHTALIVSSDHGEAFGEHGEREHAHELWEELVRVPLIVHVPGVAPRHVSTPHSHVDLAPTIMQLMGQDELSSFMGSSLVPEIDGRSGKGADVIPLELAADNIQPARRAIVAGDYKLIRFGDKAGPEKLFNLADDPGETKDLAKSDPKKLGEMHALMQETFAKIPSVAPHGGMKLKGGGTADGPTRPELASR